MKFIWKCTNISNNSRYDKNIIFNNMRYLYSNLHSFNLINGERLTEITDIQIPLDNFILESVFFLQGECFEK